MTQTPAGGSSEQWYVVKVLLSRTGRTQIYYVQATSGQAAAQSFPGGTLLGGPYASQAAAQAAFGPGSAGATTPPAGSPPAAVSTAPVNPLGGLAGIGDFFGRLTEASTWLRVLETVLGVGLIIVGLAKLAAGTQVGQAAQKIGKAAAIL